MYVAKYNASGNDFIIFHTFKKIDRSELAKKLCSRQFGIGADGLIVIVPHSEYDFEWQFYNSDGSGAEMCGNGSRACAHYAFKNQLAPFVMNFLTKAGVIGATVDGNMVETDLTPPVVIKKAFKKNGKSWMIIDTGVPHLITFLDRIDSFDIEEARALRYEYNANVNIAMISNGKIYIRTYERGVEDETLACGTGMAAAFYRAVLEKRLKKEVDVIPKSGEVLHLSKKREKITFQGLVEKTFETFIEIEI